MRLKLIYQLLLVLIALGSCTDLNQESELEPKEEQSVYYQEINEVISVAGLYNLDIDGDSIDDYYLKLYHANYNDPIFITLDTFYIEFGSLSDDYLFFDKAVDCVPCYEYFEPYETWTGACLPYKNSEIISSYNITTGIEGKEDSYLWLEKYEKIGGKDYSFNAWLRIKVSEKRDLVTIKDCALGLDKNKTLRIGER